MQILVDGFITGLPIAVLALGFTLVYLPTRVFHAALGGVYTLVPFLTWEVLRRGGTWPVAISLAVGAGTVVSLACQAFNHAPLEKKNASPGVHLISSLGIYIMLAQGVVLIWGNETRFLRPGLAPTVEVIGTVLTRSQVVTALASVAVLALFYSWLRFSNLGLRFRALADNRTELALRGYNVRLLQLLAFGISGFLGSVAALVVSYDLGFDPHGGLGALLLAIVAVIIGGRQSFIAPVLGGIILGVVRAEVVWFYSARWQDAITFSVLALFLFVRPHGVAGRKVRLEATP